MPSPILISACLLGKPVRYDGRAKFCDDAGLKYLIEQGCIFPFCPEVSGGLPTPRAAAEIQFGDGFNVLDGSAQVVTGTDEDVTEQFLIGAKQALQICQQNQIRIAILTESSPSCGSSQIYNGRFERNRISGVGVTTALLRNHNIRVFSQFEISQAIHCFNLNDNNLGRSSSENSADS